MISILIDEKFLETCGDNSLLGNIAMITNPNGPMLDPKEKLQLVFPQTTYQFKEKNKGPKEFIIYEHTIPCLIQDILTLQKLGFNIEIITPETGTYENQN